MTQDGEKACGEAASALRVDIVIAVGSGASSFVVRPNLSLVAGVLVLFGPSGSGKTLSLQAIAGLIRPSSGVIYVCGELLFDSEKGVDKPAHRRGIGYVPQQPSLFPFATVEENVAFGLPRSERKKNPAIGALMDDFGITHLSCAKPSSLSGGERQRVALARALAVCPRLLLLDEPFASVDRQGREELRRVLSAVLVKRGIPAVFVTHDEDEAIEMGDSMVVLEKGATLASGTPASLLGRTGGVVVTGIVDGVRTSLGNGRSKVRLRDVVIEGPSEMLASDTLRLDLRGRQKR